MPDQLQYTTDIFAYRRLITRELKIGSLILGGNHRTAVQSMTNTNTLDTTATVEQCIRIIEAGGELVRITAQSIAEAENLKNIKSELFAKGYTVPLAADIHFNPKLAEIAAQYVEKVRINPGNYAEKNSKKLFTEEEYQQALNKTSEKLQALIAVCKKHKTAIRIGVNHGSLSNRIMSRYGNTAKGMVESALEFVKLFEEAEFYDLIISLKSSHVLTMVHANRLLAASMLQNGAVYPIHLGVTEAGNGMEGRQKSIAGIASLLNDGIGDTIRVSLTEAPENEIPVALKLRDSFNKKEIHSESEANTPWFSPFAYHKRSSFPIENIGGKNPVVVIIGAAQPNNYKVSKHIQGIASPPADILYVGSEKPNILASGKKYLQSYSVWENEHPNCYPLLDRSNLLENKLSQEQVVFVQISAEDLISSKNLQAIKRIPSAILVLSAQTESPIAEWRKAFYRLHHAQIENPVILNRKFDLDQKETLLLEATKLFSALLLDGLGDGIWIQDSGRLDLEIIEKLSFGILQACRLRLTQTDYIACPSCGRTLFNIEERLDEVRKKTRHLNHLKIAVMGCVVNGLGEMADADYGYVGSVKGKVNLYKGKELKYKNIPEADASKTLVDLIKTEDDWFDE